MPKRSDPVSIARMPVTASTLRACIDRELGDKGNAPDLTDPVAILATDLLCDAALEAQTRRQSQKGITKTVNLTETAQIDLKETGIVRALVEAIETGQVTEEELNALLLRSSVAGTIAKALKSGVSPEDIAKAQIDIVPVVFSGLDMGPKTSGSFLGRLFGKG